MADAEKSTPAARLPLPSIGSYQLLEPLGSGGMSSVYKAVHSETGHVVAVKILPRSLAKNPTLLQRFLREAKSAESLEDPNIVAIYDRGSEGGRYYLVLEYVEGGDLHDHVRSKGPMPVRDAVGVIRSVAQGLNHAASRGLIHRDIKPANLLLDVHGHVKITDLGLALQVDEEDERVTRDGTTVGTVDYMSPDQARDSRGTSVRSDIYSLGCTSFYLLTGTPPFAGGDLPDKLRRHAQEAPPDVRASRPDVPEALAKLIQKMMAKKPDGRYADYDQLIAALDALPLEGAPDAAPAIPTALLADDDEDDDDSEDALVLTVAEPGPAGSPGARGKGGASRSSLPSTPTRDEASLADLAALDDDVPATPRKRSRPAAAAPAPSPAFDDDSLAVVGAVAPGSRRVEDASVKDYILKGLMYGVAIVLVGFVVQQAIVHLRSSPEPAEEVVDEEALPESDSFERPIVPIRPSFGPKPKAVEPLKTATVDPVVEAWHEPEDVTPLLPPERSLPTDPRFAPPGWVTERTASPAGPATVLRRVDPEKGSAGRLSIARAFERPETVVELADDGPFYERDIRFGTSSRVLRAKSGFRPIVVLEPATTKFIREQAAPFVLDGRDLTIEGVDLVVEAGPGDLPVQQTALFAVHAGTLTLRDCTVTFVGTQATSLALVSLGEGGNRAAASPPRVLIDRTLVRGPALSLVHFGDGKGEFVATRCVVLSGDAPAVTIAAKGKGPRRLDIHRSVVATQRSLVDDSSRTPGAPTVFKMLGNTFARIDRADGGPSAALIHEASSVEPGKLLDWIGDDNTFVGWSGFLTAGTSRTVKLASLEELRRSFPKSALQSRQLESPWPAMEGREWTTPGQLESISPESAPTLRRVADANPFLLERSVGAFPKLLVPETVPLPAPPAPPPPGVAKAAPVRKIQLYAETKVGNKAIAKAAKPPPPEVKAEPAGPLDLTFDLADPAFAGDLGRFFREKIPADAAHVRVVVDGQGTHSCTPFTVHPGSLLEIFVRPPAGAAPPVWTPLQGATDEALISARGADLTILGARFERDGGASLKSVVQVEDGLLTLANCWFTAPGQASGGGVLVDIRSTGTKPLTPRDPSTPPIPVARLTNCLMLTGGNAIHAELGLGVVTLENCAIASGSDAFSLNPAKVARIRFGVDLWLNHCTVIAEKTILRLGPWPGKDPGPYRPWLVSSRDCAFLDPFDRGAGSRQTVMLRDDPNGLSRGALVWQSTNDAYEVGQFILPTDAPLPAGTKPDVQREWLAFWGRSHVGRVYGPLRNAPNTQYVKLQHDDLKPGSLTPADLAIDSAYSQAHKTTGIGADARRLGIQAPQAAPGQPFPRKPR